MFFSFADVFQITVPKFPHAYDIGNEIEPLQLVEVVLSACLRKEHSTFSNIEIAVL